MWSQNTLTSSSSVRIPHLLCVRVSTVSPSLALAAGPSPTRQAASLAALRIWGDAELVRLCTPAAVGAERRTNAARRSERQRIAKSLGLDFIIDSYRWDDIKGSVQTLYVIPAWGHGKGESSFIVPDGV